MGSGQEYGETGMSDQAAGKTKNVFEIIRINIPF